MKFLITAGPTREPIDPVRYISNRSSGKMGYAIAQAALEAGHEVVLVSGPVALNAPAGAQLVRVTTADEMYDAVHAHLAGVDIAVLCAAVADFKPASCAPRKIKKRDGVPTIKLVPTRDILASLGALRPKKFLLAGFAAETGDLEKNAREKLEKKQCDAVIANDVLAPGLGFESDENALTIFLPDQSSRVLPRASKHDLANALVKILCGMQQKS
ncbi:MAG: phosphopantothenoylcysteine decarboxylase [Chthoniobacteraceae bacterium]|nr:phosphopantothenoylcysteine decarboxylase [Chthoniobacteraceae bacterium]